jgi:colanic acid biosynthesis protein WcaH
MRITAEDFLHVVKNTPLVSIDLVVRDVQGHVLVGWRTNRPARDAWFVPGGRVYKNERLADAFQRITLSEMGRAFTLADATMMGVFEHLYDDNAFDVANVSTHYIVLAYELAVTSLPSLPREQHSQYTWMDPHEMVSNPQVHENTRAYFSRRSRT